MSPAPGPRRRFDPYLYAIFAIVCAAMLVLYLQQRAVAELRGQTAMVLREIAEQTAQAVAAEVRHTLEGPVFDTLTAVNHPQIRDSRLDLLETEYKIGLASYPQVERFFVWTEQTNVLVPSEVLFLGEGHQAASPLMPTAIPEAFDRDPALGRAVFALARRYAPSQQIYAAYSQVGTDGQHDVFLRLFWTDARRDHFFAVIGFIVDRQRVHDTLIPELHRRRLDQLLKMRGNDLPFELRVSDEHGEKVWGPATSQPLAARVLLPMMFYPLLGSRLAESVDPVSWTIEVSPAHADQMLDVGAHGYSLPALSIALMLVALTFTIQAGRRAARMAQMQADFVSHVSHQLKTPLSLLSAATETVELDRVRSPEKLAQYVGIIRTEVGRLSSLVQHILEFASVQQRRPLEFDTVDLAALVRETVEAFQASLSGQRFEFRVHQDGPAPFLEADSAALEQALANLLDNAVKYSGAIREVSVRVGWSGTNAVVDITDAGIGVSPADRRRIFEKFYRGSGEAHHRQGFGLGLAIAQELVAAHRGRIELMSAAAVGSTFRITLPALAPHTYAAPRCTGTDPMNTTAFAAPGPQASSPHSVLVVDDEEEMRTMLEDNLEFDGFQVTTVDTGEGALSEIDRRPYSLVLLDVMLPGISGLEVCRRLRGRGTRIPVIMLTARTQELDRVIGLDVGADDYVSKPFSVRELMARVRAQVRRDDWHSSTGDEFAFGDVRVLLRQRLVVRRGRRVGMSAREFELLRYLIAHRNEVVSREQLLRDVWGYHELSITRTVDNYVAKLRTLLEPRPHEPRFIVTLHGSGYQLIA